MRRRSLALGSSALLLGGALFLAGRGAGTIPPLGQLLDPVHGAWAAATGAELPATFSADIPGLAGPVEVRYDRRGVPHIYAGSEEDLTRALGYVVARDRLFQLELQARAGSGRLTELVGARAVVADSEPRHLGMTRAAQLRFAALDDSSLSKRLLVAYADGVNAYLDGLPRAQWPVEYKLLGVRPAVWEPINSLHLLNRMGWTLAFATPEQRRLGVRELVGRAAAEALFPIASSIQEPIQPNGSGMARFDASPLPPPGALDSVAVALGPRGPWSGDPEVSPIFASNNWAVAPARSRSGHALLAGDPHLGLTLPSIWYEVHLVIPGRFDTYGVTIPGAPTVIIGFNRDVAWSMTNTGADVLDFYRESVDDQDRPGRYLVDGAWRDVELREESYRAPAGTTLRVDTVRFTHRGPLRRLGPDWVSMRWTVLDAADPILPFLEAQRATTAPAFLDAMARSYFAPAQNVIAADRSGNIGIRSTGHFPIRPAGTNGQRIFDGSLSANDWQGFLPVTRYPQAFNPAQGFLASANQQPIDPAQDDTYFGDEGAFDPWRALQINRLLRADSSVTVDVMRSFQTDPGSVRADLLVPYFVVAAERAAGNDLAPALALLRAWDRRYTRDNTGAILLEGALQQLVRRTWDELVPPGDTVRLATPGTPVLLRALGDSASAWWDDRGTKDVVEQRDDVVRAALGAAYADLRRRLGDPAAGGWQWQSVAQARIDHLAGLPGFSVSGLAVQGGRGTLNPSVQSGSFGSSWRMVVELGPVVRAMGTYPGGQSGNPASARYKDRVGHWAAGTLEPLLTPAHPDSLAAQQVLAALSLVPGRRE